MVGPIEYEEASSPATAWNREARSRNSRDGQQPSFREAPALGFAMPAFAGDVTTAKNAADREKAGGTWDAAERCRSLANRDPSLF